MQWEDNQDKMPSESPLEHLKKLRSLKLQGKKATSGMIHQELSANGYSETLNIMLDDLLSPEKLITETDNIEWCKWIIASGKSPNDFSTQGKLSIFKILSKASDQFRNKYLHKRFAISRTDDRETTTRAITTRKPEKIITDFFFFSRFVAVVVRL